MSVPVPNIQLEAHEVITELCSTDQGKLLWENAQLRVLSMKQNEQLIDMQKKVTDLQDQIKKDTDG